MRLIDRQEAIDALQKEINKGTPPFNDTVGAVRCGVRLARNIIEDLSTVETICGYQIKDLIVFADACRKQNISNDNLAEFCGNAQSAYHYAMVEFQKSVTEGIMRPWKEAVERIEHETDM